MHPLARRLGYGLLCLSLCLLPLKVLAEAPKVRPVRAVKLITQDEAGLPVRFPAALAYDPLEDEVYIVSPLKNKLVVLTADYFPYLSIGSGRGLNSISGGYLKDGKLYVCLGASSEDPSPHIAVYDGAFLPQKKIYFPELERFSPLSMVIGVTGNLYVVGMNGTGVMVLDAEGNYLRTIDPLDEVLGEKEKAPILALDIDSDGRLYFVSESMGRVYVYDKDERFLYRFGEKGGEPGKLSRPRGIAVDEFRRQIYLVDYQRHTVSVYATTGEYLFEIGGLGHGRGWFNYPSDVIVDGQGRLLVADTFNHRVQVFEFVGGLPPTYGEPGELLAGRPGELEPTAEPAQEPETIPVGHIDVDLATDAVGDYLVLTSISRDAQSAEELAEQLRDKGYPVHIQPLDRGARGVWQQVLVGPYVDPFEAHSVAEQLRSEELLPAILKTRGAATELEISVAQAGPPADLPEKLVAGDLNIKAAEPAENKLVFPAAGDEKPAKAPVSRARRSEVVAATPGHDEFAEEPLVELRPPNDQVHASVHTLPLPDDNAAEIQSSKKKPLSSVQEHSVPPAGEKAPQPGPVAAEAVRKIVPVPATPVDVNRAAAIKADFCVKCHDQRIAKVCMQCHPRDRRDRM